MNSNGVNDENAITLSPKKTKDARFLTLYIVLHYIYMNIEIKF